MPAYVLEYRTEAGLLIDTERWRPTPRRPKHPKQGDVLELGPALSDTGRRARCWRVKDYTLAEDAGTGVVVVVPAD